MTGPDPTSRDSTGGSTRRRSLGPWRVPALVLGWLVAAFVAVAVGTVAVTTVGATLRDRGPIGEEVSLQEGREGSAVTLDRDAEMVQRTIREDFGEFDVVCQGLYAIGGETRPDRAGGWDVVSLEPGPDDDVDAVFARRGESIEVEVYCLRGVPTVADLERNRAPSS